MSHPNRSGGQGSIRYLLVVIQFIYSYNIHIFDKSNIDTTQNTFKIEKYESMRSKKKKKKSDLSILVFELLGNDFISLPLPK